MKFTFVWDQQSILFFFYHFSGNRLRFRETSQRKDMDFMWNTRVPRARDYSQQGKLLFTFWSHLDKTDISSILYCFSVRLYFFMKKRNICAKRLLAKRNTVRWHSLLLRRVVKVKCKFY